MNNKKRVKIIDEDKIYYIDKKICLDIEDVFTKKTFTLPTIKGENK